ncbi:MAG: response regulator [Planctomycetota bacterium]
MTAEPWTVGRRRVLLCTSGADGADGTLKELLESQGHEALLTRSSDEAWRLLHASQFDAAICDGSVGDSAGIELLALIGASGMDLPVLFVAAAHDFAIAAEALQLGAAGLVLRADADLLRITCARQLERIFALQRLSRERARLTAELRKSNLELEQLVVERTRELEQSRAREQQLERLRTDLLAVTDADLRPQLQIILAVSDHVLANSGTLSNEQRGGLERVQDAARRLCNFADDAAELLEWHCGRAPLEPTEFRGDLALREGMRRVEPDAWAARVTLHREAETDPMRGADGVELAADYDIVTSALERVLRHAVQASRGGGHVFAATSLSASGYQIRIVDTGSNAPTAARIGAGTNGWQRQAGNLEARGSNLGLAVAIASLMALGARFEIVPAMRNGIGNTYLIEFPRASLRGLPVPPVVAAAANRPPATLAV